jgi:hypothetical protein
MISHMIIWAVQVLAMSSQICEHTLGHLAEIEVYDNIFAIPYPCMEISSRSERALVLIILDLTFVCKSRPFNHRATTIVQ